MKRPAFQFYPADWRNNVKLRRCSWGARGVWIEMLALMHDSEEYGVLRWPLTDIAIAIGAPPKLVRELAEKGVLKGGDDKSEAYVYTPRSGGRDGAPVTLVEGNVGPCWYSSRFVRDEHLRLTRGVSTRFKSGADPPPDQSPSQRLGSEPSQRQGTRQGYGASSSSSTSLKPKTLTTLSGKPDALELESQDINGHDHSKRKQPAREKLAIAERVIDFLNEKTDKNFEDVPANTRLIIGRLNEGATEQDCRSVIALKTRQWKNDPKMNSCLCPKTLFNATNFAQYKGALGREDDDALPGM